MGASDALRRLQSTSSVTTPYVAHPTSMMQTAPLIPKYLPRNALPLPLQGSRWLGG
ncbi:uncharacterized protein TrAtP1_004415 [Trichoderma atroviride]|uniref:uncharacterized protein n=1 Tax=Hypocrea atroviridis TaxID=63577 RepID=UPI003331BD9D|nr:hypothetical protein TrAtP1_004415 [Trichoderma atroviride]